jgi:hypothetical protein
MTISEKYCSFCNGTFAADSGHWRVHSAKNNFLECKEQARQSRRGRAKEKNLAKHGTADPRHSEEYRAMVAKKRQETCLKKYGAKNAMQVKEIKEKQQQSLLKSYGVTSPSKNSDIIQKIQQTNLEKYGAVTNLRAAAVIEKAKKAKQDKFSILLSDGERLRDFCDRQNISRAWAYKVYKYGGEEALKSYADNYSQRVTNIELYFIDIMKDFSELSLFNKRPSENIPYRPDFCIEKNGRKLFVNLNGLYWHSEIKQEDSSYHQKIRQAFEQESERIMQFNADELLDSPTVVKSMIANFFGVNKKIFARKCEVKPVTSAVATEFMDKNHLMKAHPASTSFGLYQNDELVACMSVRFNKPSINIERFATKCGLTVVGGFSKLLSHIEALFKPNSIISYCDLRYSSGQSYEKCGFALRSSSLGFKWTDGIRTYNRLYCRAKMDDRQLSEAEYSKEKGLFKIYDAGQAKYVKVLEEVDDTGIRAGEG